MSTSELAMMAALVLDDGKRWGEKATDFQLADAKAIFAEDRPNWHFITRPRGGSKTTDIAGVSIAYLVEKARPFDRGYVIASNSQQAALLIDAAAGFVARTPELADTLTVESERILAASGAWVRVLPQSDSGSWGLLNTHLIVCDEFAQWPDTRGARRVWTAIRSTTQKTPGCRLIILTSAGEPSHWSYTEVWKGAHREIDLAAQQGRLPFWRISETPGPVPWQDPEELEQLRNTLLPSEFERLILNIWSEAEDRAISPEDYKQAAKPCTVNGTAPASVRGGGHRLRWPGEHKYVITVDFGSRHDATVMCVSHREDHPDIEGAKQLVVDHLERWQGSKLHHVQTAAVRRRLTELSYEYGRATVYADPDQFVGTLQDLNKDGVKAVEWPFTATSVGVVATALVQTFRNAQIIVPDTPALREELLKVRLRESAPGVTRLDHDKNQHDDQAVAIGLACHLLMAGQWGQGAAWLQTWRNEMSARTEKPGDMSDHSPTRYKSAMEQPTLPKRCPEPRYGFDGVCWNCGTPQADHPERAA